MAAHPAGQAPADAIDIPVTLALSEIWSRYPSLRPAPDTEHDPLVGILRRLAYSAAGIPCTAQPAETS